MEKFKNFNKKSIIDGYEGIMIKDPKSYYECKRSTTWLKSKPFIEISLEVKDYEEGTGRNKGKLGAVIAEGKMKEKTLKQMLDLDSLIYKEKNFGRQKKSL